MIRLFVRVATLQPGAELAAVSVASRRGSADDVASLFRVVSGASLDANEGRHGLGDRVVVVAAVGEYLRWSAGQHRKYVYDLSQSFFFLCSTIETQHSAHIMASPVTLKLRERSVQIPTGLFINGEFVAAKSGKTFDSEDPGTGSVLASVCEGDKEDVDLAVKAARAAFNKPEWSSGPPTERARLMNRLADLMDQHKDDIIAVECADTGKTLRQASNLDFPGAVGTLRYYAGWCDKVLGESSLNIPGAFAFTRREPLGVCGQIIPWK